MSYEAEYNSHPRIEQLSDSSEDEEPRQKQTALRRNKKKKRHDKSKKTTGVSKDSQSLTRANKYGQQISEGPSRAAEYERNQSRGSNGVARAQQQQVQGGKESLSVRLDLNLEAEVFLRAKIYGDITLSLE
jgi:hypothetical protein